MADTPSKSNAARRGRAPTISDVARAAGVSSMTVSRVINGDARVRPTTRARVDEARMIVAELEDLPHFAPSYNFANRVMAQVPVFVPWHVTARQTIAQFIPQSRSARIAVAGLATAVASVLTVGLLWISTQTDVLVVASGAAGMGKG